MAVLTGIELCAGVSMLGEGARAAFRFLGHDYRTICYVEREAAAAGQLVTLMEAGIIDSAPIWSDMLTFNGSPWRGRVDCVIAGFPCQDLSIAGRRAGLDGKRSGLFFRVCDIADDCQARILILENVSAIASATASVVDEAEGELDERAASRVMGELADRGWDSEWITLSASSVGANHRRNRWFCFAWRVADAECAERRAQRTAGSRGGQGHDGSGQAHGGAGIAIEVLGNTRLQHQQLQQWPHGPEHQRAGSQLAHAQNAHRRRKQQPSCARRGRPGSTGDYTIMADTNFSGLQIGGRTRMHREREARPLADFSSDNRMAHPVGPRLQIRNGGGGHNESLQPTKRPDAISVCDAFGIFAPGPDSADWPGIINRYPWLTPTIESGLRGVVDGSSLVVDESRTHQLRALGNGVVPLQAATALVLLFRRSGIRIE